VSITLHPSAELVRSCALARHLSPEQSALLATILGEATYPAHAVLAREGAVDQHLVLVVSGSLRLVKNLGAADETLITTIAPGEMAHELGFLDGTERYASLVAATETRVLVLEREAMEALVDSQPRLMFGIMRAIVHHVHRTQTRLAMQANELTNYIVKQHGRY
jgi:CRP-like cAMP-binding protein